MAINIAGMPTCHESLAPFVRTHHVKTKMVARNIKPVIDISYSIRLHLKSGVSTTTATALSKHLKAISASGQLLQI
jgi:hypothetical protein